MNVSRTVNLSSVELEEVQQAKQQILHCMKEVAQRAAEDIPAEEFFKHFLQRSVSAMAAIGGAVWTFNPEGQLALRAELAFQEAGIHNAPDAQAKHSRLLHTVLQGGRPVIVMPFANVGDEDTIGNPTRFILLFSILHNGLETVGLVEILQRPEIASEVQQGHGQFLAQMCELANDYLKNQQLRSFTGRQILWTQVEDFCRRIHASLDPRTTAYTVANEGRRLIQCDRLTVAIRRRGRCQVEAISGQEVFDRRANTVRLLEQLATTVTAAGEAVWYSGEGANLPGQVEEALQNYLDEAHSKTIGVLPLVPPTPESEEGRARRPEPPSPVGALIVEQIEDSRAPPALRQRVELVRTHAAVALHNALEHHSVPLLFIWRAVAKAPLMVKARNLPRTVGIVGLILLVLAVLCLWPVRFSLHAKGTLEPVCRKNVFAGAKGRVTELRVKHGQRVAKGELLLRLRDTELEIAMRDVEGQLITTRERVYSLERQLLEPKGLTIEERNRLAGELAAAKEKLAALKIQQELHLQRQAELEIRSPIAGEITTWDLENRLSNVPVQRGQMLLQVADTNGPWQLELRMPESEVGYLTEATRGLKSGESLPVEFQLASEPGRTFRGTVEEVHLSAEVRGDEGNTVLVKVKIDKDELPHLRPGTTVTAHVFVDRRPLGFVWFRDLWAFWRSKIVFRYF
jgi:multidrug efflux pump subunit AcrA (membrane-fusion protein)